MASQSLYRKWRSQTFAQIVGQEHVVQTLRNAIVEERVAHAYLFTGPRGVGKTSMARLLAKAVNCMAPPQERPCGTCEPCLAIAEGRAVDVIEMDAASHTSVEDAREIIERVQFRPTTGRYKVYVIDEVHMLSTAAFNALLKTLEEPPEHAIFILATTEIHKVPATILSRCQRFTFSRHSIATAAAHVQRIADEENLHLEPGVADAIARSATGSLRDALGVLEQLGSFAGGAITLEQVQSLLGMTSATEVYTLIEALLEGNLTRALRSVNSIADQGADVRQFTRDLIEHLRALMLFMATNDKALLDVSDDEFALIEQWGAQADIGLLTQWIKFFSNLDYQLRTSPYGHLPLELAVVEALLAQPTPAAPPAAMPKPAARPPAKRDVPEAPVPPAASSPAPAPAPPAASSPAPTPAPASPTSTPAPASPAPEPAAASSPTPAPEKQPEPAAEVVDAQDVGEGESVFDKVCAVWPLVVRDVKPYNPSLQGILRDVNPVDVEGTTIILHAASPFHKDNTEKPRSRKTIEEVLSKHMGAYYSFRCIVDKPVKKDDTRTQMQQARKDPLVHKAMNIFGAEIVSIEPREDAE